MKMPNARRPKKYPDGEGLPVTRKWKEKVQSILDANKDAGRSPGSMAELARMINVDKSGLSKMLQRPKMEKTKYAPPIIKLLGVEPAMIETPDVPQDELDRIVDKIRALPLRKHEHAMEQLRLLARMLDES